MEAKSPTQTTTEPTTRSTDEHAATGPLFLWGLTVWLAVAVTIRLVGHVLLSPATPLVLAGFFAAVVPLMALVTYPVYRYFGLPRGRRTRAAIVMSLPGLLLDVLLVLGHDIVFPAMGPRTAVNFGAILLFGYAVVLLTALVPGPD